VTVGHEVGRDAHAIADDALDRTSTAFAHRRDDVDDDAATSIGRQG
jgi:hypothetical protein